MIDLLLLLGLASILNWAIVDIYFYSIVFDAPRQYSENWSRSQGFLKHFRYMLGCPFCLSHWTAAVILTSLSAIGYFDCVPMTLHPVAAIMFIPAVARVSLVLRDYSLPPLVNSHVSENTEEAPTKAFGEDTA
jgi:hypothetical protein